QDASFRAPDSRRRQAGALRRQNRAGGRVVFHPAYLSGWLPDHRDSASLMNSQRLKGIHMAIKSGMLAAETILDALRTGDTSAEKLSAFRRKIEESWIARELRSV